MYVCIYVCVYISLSLYIYIYIYVYSPAVHKGASSAPAAASASAEEAHPILRALRCCRSAFESLSRFRYKNPLCLLRSPTLADHHRITFEIGCDRPWTPKSGVAVQKTSEVRFSSLGRSERRPLSCKVHASKPPSGCVKVLSSAPLLVLPILLLLLLLLLLLPSPTPNAACFQTEDRYFLT